MIVCFFALILIAQWAYVNVAPELNKNIVFVKSISETLIGDIASGGQTPPILKVGDKLEWKKSPKKSKKKNNFRNYK